MRSGATKLLIALTLTQRPWDWNFAQTYPKVLRQAARRGTAASKADRRKRFLTQHIIIFCNLLPQDVMEAKSINEFKEKKKKGLDGSVQPLAQEVPPPPSAGSREESLLCVLPFRNPFLSICSWSSQGCYPHPTGHSLWMEPQPCFVPLDLLYQGWVPESPRQSPFGWGW